MFIDDVDEDDLSIMAWAFVDKHGWIGQIEAPYQVRDALYKGFYAGYEQARKDEKEMYAEAKQLIEETHRRQRYQDMAAIYKAEECANKSLTQVLQDAMKDLGLGKKLKENK